MKKMKKILDIQMECLEVSERKIIGASRKLMTSFQLGREEIPNLGHPTDSVMAHMSDAAFMPGLGKKYRLIIEEVL